MTDLIVYADGFGRWCADVPTDAPYSLLAAREAITAALVEREQKVGETAGEAQTRMASYVEGSLLLSPRQDRPGYTRYVEYLLEGEGLGAEQ